MIKLFVKKKKKKNQAFFMTVHLISIASSISLSVTIYFIYELVRVLFFLPEYKKKFQIFNPMTL